MVRDLDDLLRVCDQTIAATARRENSFRSILAEADKKMKETTL